MTAVAVHSNAAAPAPALTRREHRRLADALLRAADLRRPIAPLSEHFPELTQADAGRIRDTGIVSRIARGEQLIGAKAWLAPGGEPCLGWLTDAMVLAAPSVDVNELIRPRLEAKLAFVLGRRLRTAVHSVAQLLEATARVAPCLEVIDARYDGAAFNSVDAVADNCSAACLLVGAGLATPGEGEVGGVVVELDGRALAPAAQPSTVEATLWLANRVVAEGGELEPGALLLSPACTAAVDLRAGGRVEARFGPLGELALDQRP